MKINLAKSAGFCFGVRRALNIAFKTAVRGAKVYMLGDIVHNNEVIRQAQKNGIKKIKELGNGKGKTLLIRAHGTSSSVIKQARAKGYKVVDATCPMVKEIHKIARDMEKKGYRIIIIGDKNHAEVRGIIGQLKKDALVINKARAIPRQKIKEIKKAAVVIQSTQNTKEAEKIAAAIKLLIKNVEVFNTVCGPTRAKQAEARKMPLENDVMLIIGSRSSANTKRLYQICKRLNKRSYWIESEEDIQPAWLKKAESAGVTAGASTSEWAIKGVIDHLRSYA